MSDCFNTLQNEKGIVKYIDFQKKHCQANYTLCKLSDNHWLSYKRSAENRTKQS